MTDWDAVSAFMANVVAWPGPNDCGHVGLWFSMPNKQFDPAKLVSIKNKPTIMTGTPFKDLDQLVATARRMNEQPGRYKHAYFCTSRQRKQGLNKRGNPKAQKSAADALYQKSIFIDIDIKPNSPKHYATHGGAWDEFAALRKKVGLPAPSAIVNTGGGLHIYWISKTPLLPHEWQPYANGLKQVLLSNNFKFDPTCTGDIARILRVPGTFNHKYDPPKEAQLLPLPLVLYDFETELALLKPFAGPTVTAALKVGFSPWAENAPPSARESLNNGPASAFAALKSEPELVADIEKHKNFKVDPRPIFTECGFYREALRERGARHDQPLWNLAILGTTFMENGGAIAHKISSGHSTYTRADTRAMYDRKLAERASSGGLG